MDEELFEELLESVREAGAILCEEQGFKDRVRGSHHIFVREDVSELLNLQRAGAKAKPYQVKQVRAVIVRHGLGGEV